MLGMCVEVLRNDLLLSPYKGFACRRETERSKRHQLLSSLTLILCVWVRTVQ